jgi:SNF2 family DNA or RNA helicase
MGLGKTHQALALLDLLIGVDKGADGEQENYLIVCPTSVLYHWPEKQQAFFPQLDLVVHHGPGRDLAQARTARIVVTTYGVLHRDAEQFGSIPFRLVLFDEMHSLKNRKTGAFAAAAGLDTENVIGLTGTPVENSIDELATLLFLCLPDLFAVPGFQQQFDWADNSEERRQLQRSIAPFILRRTRQQVLKDLPECSEDIRLCALSSDQVAAYRQAVDQVKGMVDTLMGEQVIEDFSHILTTIMRLKQICNHLCQLEGCTDWLRFRSGKWDEFTRLLNQCLKGGLKVVVFSQFTGMLDIMEAWLAEEKIGFVGLRGSVSPIKRSEYIKRFNSSKGCSVCCASLLAGGTGIDLTGAQVVIHYDRWWNPAKEEQATARVHRMGQVHPVQVYKLVTVGTLEEKIHQLIERKRALAAELIVEDDGSILKALNRKELAGLFDYADLK